MKLKDLCKVQQIEYNITKLKGAIKDFSNKPICIATDYLGESSHNSHQKLLRIETDLANVIITELERQIECLYEQLQQLGVEVDE